MISVFSLSASAPHVTLIDMGGGDWGMLRVTW